jgi:hypothetical protein
MSKLILLLVALTAITYGVIRVADHEYFALSNLAGGIWVGIWAITTKKISWFGDNK